MGFAYIPGLDSSNLPPSYQGSQAYQQPPAYQSPPYVARTTDDLTPHDYEHTKDVEIREKLPSDEAWCRQSHVADTLREIGSMRSEISQRCVYEMASQVTTRSFKPNLITAITGMSGGEH